MPTIPAEEIFKTLTPEGQSYVKEQGAKLINEYQNLKAIRQKLGLTQNDVADIMSLNQSNISEIEARKDMKISSLKAYAQALGYEMNIIFKASDDTVIRVDEVFNS